MRNCHAQCSSVPPLVGWVETRQMGGYNRGEKPQPSEAQATSV